MGLGLVHIMPSLNVQDTYKYGFCITFGKVDCTFSFPVAISNAIVRPRDQKTFSLYKTLNFFTLRRV